eukprot:gene9263-1350_t
MRFLFFITLLFVLTQQDITTKTVKDGEYPAKNFVSFEQGTVFVRWKNFKVNGSSALEFAVVSKATGWTAIGFNPTSGMSNLDLVVGFMSGGNIVVEDHYVNGLTTPSKDINVGGQDSIIAFNGGSAGGEITFKFQRLTNTGDPRDNVIINGSNSLIYAYSPNPNPAVQHGNGKGSLGDINFLNEDSTPPVAIDPLIIFPFHYIVLPLIVSLVCILGIASQFLHKVPPFDIILQAKLIPPLPTLLPETVLPQFLLDYFNEVTGVSFGEIFVVVCYLIISACWTVVSYCSAYAYNTDPWNVLGRVFGSLNLLNFTFVLLPIARHSIWTVIFGIPFERAIKYHRWIAVWTYICMCLHFIFIAIFNGVRNTPAYPWSTNYTAGLAGVYGTGLYGYVFCGFVAWIFFTIQILFTMLRRAFWNFFAYTHLLLAIIAIVFACIHHYHVLLHLSASLFLYFIDYAFRKISFLIPAKVINMKPMAGGITRVEIQSPLARLAKPGQYVFIFFPQASTIGRNPFSISSITGPDTITLHVKGMKGKPCWPTFTGKLKSVAHKVEEGTTKPYFIRIEGPYGRPSIKFDNYKVLLLVSGGIGVTPNGSMLQHMLKQIKEGKLPNLEKVYFVWSTRTIESLEWFGELFEECAKESKIDLRLCLSKAPGEANSKIPFIEGRPQYAEIFSEIQENHPKVKYFGCVACGPGGMVSKVETLCWSNSFNSIKRQWHFHKESFLL